MKGKERREGQRNNIRVLVNCLPPEKPVVRNGHRLRGWEMWARDIGDDGVGLQWSLDWASSRCPHCQGTASKTRKKEECECIPPQEHLKEGQIIRLDGLVYDESGSQTMEGRIRWVRPTKKGRDCEFGVYIVSPNHREFFRALEEG